MSAGGSTDSCQHVACHFQMRVAADTSGMSMTFTCTMREEVMQGHCFEQGLQAQYRAQSHSPLPDYNALALGYKSDRLSLSLSF
jgi:hypothetical protein